MEKVKETIKNGNLGFLAVFDRLKIPRENGPLLYTRVQGTKQEREKSWVLQPGSPRNLCCRSSVCYEDLRRWRARV